MVLAALLAWRHTRNVSEWYIMTDELQYLKLGQSLSDGSFPRPTLRGEHVELLSLLYPILIAPAVALLSAPEGYQLLHTVNAMLFASTAIPVYLLAREVGVARLPAYVAAALAVVVPWAAITGVVMTESAAYPAFVWALLAIQRALVVPSLRRDAVALAAIGVAFFARTQFIGLAIAFPGLIVLHELVFARLTRAAAHTDAGRADRGQLPERLRPHAPLGALVTLGLVLLLLPGDPLKRLLGPFQNTVFEGSALPDGLANAMSSNLILVAGGLGIVPLALALGWALASLVRPLDRRSHAFALTALVVGALLAYEVAIFGLGHADGPLDRYLFYVAPLIIVATVACLTQGRGRPIGLALGAGITFWLLQTAGVSFAAQTGLYANSPASEFHRVFEGQAQRIGSAFGIDELSPVTVFAWGTLIAAVAVSLLVRRARPQVALALAALPLLGLALAQADYVAEGTAATINRSGGAVNRVPLVERDWIDEALPAAGDVALAPSPLGDPYTSQRVWWNAEFWNKRVNRGLVLAGYFGDNTPFPQQSMSLDETGGAIRTVDGHQPRYMVFARSQLVFRPRGDLLAEYRTVIPQDPGLELFDVQRPYRAGWIASGAAPDGWIVRGTPATVRVFPRTDGRAQQVRVNVDLPVGGVKPSPFAISEGGRTLRARAYPGSISGDAELTLCVAPERERTVTISTNAVRPLPDGRTVGVHLYSIRVTPADGGCRRAQRE